MQPLRGDPRLRAKPQIGRRPWQDRSPRTRPPGRASSPYRNTCAASSRGRGNAPPSSCDSVNPAGGRRSALPAREQPYSGGVRPRRAGATVAPGLRTMTRTRPAIRVRATGSYPTLTLDTVPDRARFHAPRNRSARDSPEQAPGQPAGRAPGGNAAPDPDRAGRLRVARHPGEGVERVACTPRPAAGMHIGLWGRAPTPGRE